MKKILLFVLCAIPSINWCMQQPSAPSKEIKDQAQAITTSTDATQTNNSSTTIVAVPSVSSSSGLFSSSSSSSITLAQAPTTPYMAALLQRVQEVEARNQQLERERNGQFQRIATALENQEEETRQIRRTQQWSRIHDILNSAKTDNEKYVACLACLCQCCSDCIEEGQRQQAIEEKTE